VGIFGYIASIAGLIAVGFSIYFYFEWGKNVGRRQERERWQAIEGAEQWAAYFEKQGNASAAAEKRAYAEKLRREK